MVMEFMFGRIDGFTKEIFKMTLEMVMENFIKLTKAYIIEVFGKMVLLLKNKSMKTNSQTLNPIITFWSIGHSINKIQN